MFLNLAALWSLASQEGTDTPSDLSGMTFDASVPTNSAGAANSIDVRYAATRVQWQYAAESGMYLRFSDGAPHVDANTGTQVSGQCCGDLRTAHRY
ncbi:MAG: DUF3048 C-terminal domain-containing protein [Anaerolineae bacterium]